MFPLLVASLLINRMWYAVPLVIAISLVYGATRHELMSPILRNALRTGVWIIGFMAVIFLVIAFMSWSL